MITCTKYLNEIGLVMIKVHLRENVKLSYKLVHFVNEQLFLEKKAFNFISLCLKKFSLTRIVHILDK